jgi:acyl-CoA reductase-like NAD-dependent aldehyde dehydrogenase
MSQVETKVTLPDGTTYTQLTGILIDGIFTASADESWFESVDPYTQKPICSVARGKEIDIHRAVQSAKASLREWKKINPQQKGRFLCSLADLMERDGEILARIEVNTPMIA